MTKEELIAKHTKEVVVLEEKIKLQGGYNTMANIVNISNLEQLRLIIEDEIKLSNIDGSCNKLTMEIQNKIKQLKKQIEPIEKRYNKIAGSHHEEAKGLSLELIPLDAKIEILLEILNNYR